MRVLANLIGWVVVALLVFVLVFGYGDAPWFTPALGALAALAIAAMVVPAVRDARARRRRQGELPDLSDIDALHADPTSGVWRLSPPCGYEWALYRPGSGVLDEHGFITATPTATRQPVGEAYDPAYHGDEPQSLEQLRSWAVPWIEEVSGGQVVEFIEGWGAPYGPDRNLHEYTVFAEVWPREDAAAQSSSSSREPQPNT